MVKYVDIMLILMYFAIKVNDFMINFQKRKGKKFQESISMDMLKKKANKDLCSSIISK